MNKDANDAIEKAWTLTVKARALCPSISESAIGSTAYASPSWYQKHGAVYFVVPTEKLTAKHIIEIGHIGDFVNRSFVITMVAILEEYGVDISKKQLDCSKGGGKHTELAKWMRNRFAHGEWQYDASCPKHIETFERLKELFPNAISGEPCFVTSIDKVLEPLKDGVLTYIRSTS